MSLVERIRTVAEKNELTLAKVERDLGFGNGTIRKWDSNSPSVDKVSAVANYLNVSVDYLLERTDNQQVSTDRNNSSKFELPAQAKLDLIKSIEDIINKYKP